ncbi:unnamed protein product [Orchesella dallaii]|uniref:Uncharacterized protein n=1 Tax=Orchesella dallaii TaxID=48710 RepID=A0ABP1R8I1_9HEXA
MDECATVSGARSSSPLVFCSCGAVLSRSCASPQKYVGEYAFVVGVDSERPFLFDISLLVSESCYCFDILIHPFLMYVFMCILYCYEVLLLLLLRRTNKKDYYVKRQYTTFFLAGGKNACNLFASLLSSMEKKHNRRVVEENTHTQARRLSTRSTAPAAGDTKPKPNQSHPKNQQASIY